MNHFTVPIVIVVPSKNEKYRRPKSERRVKLRHGTGSGPALVRAWEQAEPRGSRRRTDKLSGCPLQPGSSFAFGPELGGRDVVRRHLIEPRQAIALEAAYGLPAPWNQPRPMRRLVPCNQHFIGILGRFIAGLASALCFTSRVFDQIPKCARAIIPRNRHRHRPLARCGFTYLVMIPNFTRCIFFVRKAMSF